MAKSMKPGGGGRFDALSAALEQQGARDPKALAAVLGRRKFGKKRFQQMAANGRARAAGK